MKTKITFEVNGSNRADIERRALTQIAEFLGIEPDDVESKCDIELHIEPSSTGDFKATVYVRVK
jgi:hypothetical protein